MCRSSPSPLYNFLFRYTTCFYIFVTLQAHRFEAMEQYMFVKLHEKKPYTFNLKSLKKIKIDKQ